MLVGVHDIGPISEMSPFHPVADILVAPGWTRDGHGSGRPASRVGSVGSRDRFKANLAGLVGSKFLKCVIFQSS